MWKKNFILTYKWQQQQRKASENLGYQSISSSSKKLVYLLSSLFCWNFRIQFWSKQLLIKKSSQKKKKNEEKTEVYSVRTKICTNLIFNYHSFTFIFRVRKNALPSYFICSLMMTMISVLFTFKYYSYLLKSTTTEQKKMMKQLG